MTVVLKESCKNLGIGLDNSISQLYHCFIVRQKFCKAPKTVEPEKYTFYLGLFDSIGANLVNNGSLLMGSGSRVSKRGSVSSVEANQVRDGMSAASQDINTVSQMVGVWNKLSPIY